MYNMAFCPLQSIRIAVANNGIFRRCLTFQSTLPHTSKPPPLPSPTTLHQTPSHPQASSPHPPATPALCHTPSVSSLAPPYTRPRLTYHHWSVLKQCFRRLHGWTVTLYVAQGGLWKRRNSPSYLFLPDGTHVPRKPFLPCLACQQHESDINQGFDRVCFFKESTSQFVVYTPLCYEFLLPFMIMASKGRVTYRLQPPFPAGLPYTGHMPTS